MNCPFCGKEMEKGFVQGKTGIWWVEKRHFVSPAYGFGKDKKIDLNPEAFYSDAYLCEDCKKVIVDYKTK